MFLFLEINNTTIEKTNMRFRNFVSQVRLKGKLHLGQGTEEV